MWRVSYQDYRYWRKVDFKERYPEVRFEDYADRDAAEQAKKKLTSEGYTACVAPTPVGRIIWGRRNHKIVDGERFNKTWKLAK